MLRWMKSLLSFPNAAHKEAIAEPQNRRIVSSATVSKPFLMIGLGNPGLAYEKTRHNIGFRAVRYFGKRHKITLKKVGRLLAEVGHGEVSGCCVSLVLPLTYMNESGVAAKKAIEAFKVPLTQMIVVVDDIALPLGEIRLRDRGSSGGHNGLKSIEEALQTQEYPRLRLGVGEPQERGVLADYVLDNFEPGEESVLPGLFAKTADLLEAWMKRYTAPA